MNIEMLNFNLTELINTATIPNNSINFGENNFSNFDSTLSNFVNDRENFSQIHSLQYDFNNTIPRQIPINKNANNNFSDNKTVNKNFDNINKKTDSSFSDNQTINNQNEEESKSGYEMILDKINQLKDSKDNEKLTNKLNEIKKLSANVSKKVSTLSFDKKDTIFNINPKEKKIQTAIKSIKQITENKANGKIDNSDIILKTLENFENHSNEKMEISDKGIKEKILNLTKSIVKNKDKLQNKNLTKNTKTIEKKNIPNEIKKFESSISKIAKLFNDFDLDKFEVKDYKKIIDNLKSLFFEDKQKSALNEKVEPLKDNLKFENIKNSEITKILNKMENIALKHNQHERKNTDKEQMQQKENNFTKQTLESKFAKTSKLFNIKDNFANKFTEKLDMNKIIDQIKKSLKPPMKNEVTIQLKPAHLGKLKVMLVMENNALKAHITTEHNNVQNSILNNMQQLEAALKEKGINLSNFTVTVEDNNDLNKKNNSENTGQNKSKKSRAVNFDNFENEDFIETSNQLEDIIEKLNTNLNIKI